MAIINIRGILVYMLLYIAPNAYGPYITTDRKGIKKVINQCVNAICVTMVSSLLYYYKFCNTLKLNKFKMNSYDPCVSNRFLNELQQSIPFHVGNFKLIHKGAKVIGCFVGVLSE